MTLSRGLKRIFSVRTELALSVNGTYGIDASPFFLMSSVPTGRPYGSPGQPPGKPSTIGLQKPQRGGHNDAREFHKSKTPIMLPCENERT